MDYIVVWILGKDRDFRGMILKFVSVSTGIRFEIGWACLPLDQEWITQKIKKSFLQTTTKDW